MLVSLIAFFLPSFLGVPFRRVLASAQLSSDSKIGLFTFVHVKELRLEGNARIGSFAIIKANKLVLREESRLKGPCIIKANSISLGEYASISPLAIVNAPLMDGADLTLGSHSQIFPFCWLEPGEGIEIGNQVGVGGHTLIFTHGSWSNYINGGPVSFGKVIIEDGVWLPWRVFILPNVTIGKNAIISAHSTVSKSIPANSLAGGSPAKVIREDFVTIPSQEERVKRIQTLLQEYPKFFARKVKPLSMPESEITEDLILKFNKLDASFDFNSLVYKNPKDSKVVEDFAGFISRYGVRMSRSK